MSEVLFSILLSVMTAFVLFVIAMCIREKIRRYKGRK